MRIEVSMTFLIFFRGLIGLNVIVQLHSTRLGDENVPSSFNVIHELMDACGRIFKEYRSASVSIYIHNQEAVFVHAR
jgi:hypothetical protein